MAIKMKFRAKVYGKDKVIESKSILRTTDKEVFLINTEATSLAGHDGTPDEMGDIYEIRSDGTEALFIRVDPDTLEVIPDALEVVPDAE